MLYRALLLAALLVGAALFYLAHMVNFTIWLLLATLAVSFIMIVVRSL